MLYGRAALAVSLTLGLCACGGSDGGAGGPSDASSSTGGTDAGAAGAGGGGQGGQPQTPDAAPGGQGGEPNPDASAGGTADAAGGTVAPDATRSDASAGADGGGGSPGDAAVGGADAAPGGTDATPIDPDAGPPDAGPGIDAAPLADAILPADAVSPTDAAAPDAAGPLVCEADWQCADPDRICLAGQCVPNPATDACRDAPVLDGPADLEVVIPATNDRYHACGFADGPEVAFRLPATEETYCVSTIGSGGDTVLAVRPDCADDAGDVICRDDISGRVRATEVTVGPHEAEYVLLVDSFRLDGPVRLSVSAGPCLQRPDCASDADCVGPDEICELDQCWPVAGRDACEALCVSFATCAGAADTPCTCNGPGHELFYEQRCLEGCGPGVVRALEDAGAACEALMPAMTAANDVAHAACDTAEPGGCLLDIQAGLPLPACLAYAEKLVSCVVDRCAPAGEHAALLTDATAAHCTDAFDSPFEPPVASGPEELLFLASLDCDDPALAERTRAVIEPDFALTSRLVLGGLCQTGLPNNDPDTCSFYCPLRDACIGPAQTLPEARCQADCQLSDTEHFFAQCGAFALDCDGFFACTHGDLATERPGTLAVFPADHTFAPNLCLPAFPGQADDMLAVRLFPPTYPYRVDALEYVVMNYAGFQFDAGLAHTAEVWVQQAFEPLARPASQRLAVPAAAIDEDRLRRIELPLAQPIVLQDGDVLFVGVHLPVAPDGDQLCIAAGLGIAPPETFWWSDSPGAPYGWSPLDAWFIQDPFAIFALGAAL